MKFLNKTTFKIAFSCFFAPTFSWIIFLLFVTTLYQSIGFKNYTVAKNTVFGCVLQPWKTYFQIIYKFYHLFWIVLAYFISRKGFIQQNNNFKILGAFLFYPAVALSLRTLFYNPLYFLSQKLYFLNFKNTPIFGNLYTQHWVMFIVNTLLLLLVSLVSYQIMYKFWNKQMRISYVTIGFVSAFLGGLFWFRLVGNLFVKLL
jgi:hypothetical protein